MNKTGVIGVTAAVLLLSGCASAAPQADPNATYLEGVRADGVNYFETFTDEQLVSLGKQACDEYKGGADVTDMRLINGELEYPATGAYRHSETIATWAATTYCPDFG